jgi:hypothetical protein
LGFELSIDGADGVIEATGYDSKVGQELIFLTAAAPWVEDGSHFEWTGEDGSQWRWAFIKGVLFVENAELVWGKLEPMSLLEVDNAAR